MADTPEPCGCRVEWEGEFTRHHPRIVYCPTHAAAPDLLAALEDALAEIHANLGCDPRCEEIRHAALAQAKGEAANDLQ